MESSVAFAVSHLSLERMVHICPGSTYIRKDDVLSSFLGLSFGQCLAWAWL